MTGASQFQHSQGTDFAKKLYNWPSNSTYRCANFRGTLRAKFIGSAHLCLSVALDARRPGNTVSSDMLASSILQSYLSSMADAVITERFDIYSAGVHLPFSIVTSAASLSVTTVEDLQDGFDDFNEMLQGHGVTRIIQTVKVAMFESNDRIVGIHQTRLMDGSRQVLPEYYSKMWIGCFDGIWKAIRTHNTTNDTRWPIMLTRLAPLPWPTEET